MKNNIQIYFLVSAFIICSCSIATEEKYKNLTEKKPQSVTQRSVQDLTLMDSLNTTKAFDQLSFDYIKYNGTSIFAKLEHQIIKLNKENLSTEGTFTIREGRGPGEIVDFDATRFDVWENGIAIYDRKAKKTAIYDLNGNFREEFLNGAYSVRAMVMANGQTYYVQLFPGREYLFYEVERKGSESEITRQFQEQSNDIETLAYNGSIIYHNQSLYFAGYSEPLIRRYDLSGDNVELVFSRAVIDDYDSENNYRKPEGVTGGGRFWSYTEEAKFASEDIAVDDNYLYSVRHYNDEEGYKYLDVYSVEDGSYKNSFSLQFYPTEIVVGDEYIYTREFKNGELKQTYLMKYQKPEIDF